MVAVSDRSRAWSRAGQRAVHLALAIALGLFVYSPLSALESVEFAVRLVVFPGLVLSGLLMWRGASLRRWRRNP